MAEDASAYPSIQPASVRGVIRSHCNRRFTITTATPWVVCLLWLTAAPLAAAPYDGEPFSLLQPDLTHVEVLVYGDEFYQRVESPDGYTLIRDPDTGWICYAERSADGFEFLSTGVVYTPTRTDDPDDPQVQVRRRLTRSLRLEKTAIRRQAARRRLLLLGDDAGDEPTARLSAAPAPLIGTVVGLTIPIQFPDVPGTVSQSEIDNFCNQVGYTGYGNNGSVRDYFYDVSNGNLEYINIVTQYYTARYNKSYYDDCTSARTSTLISEALNWLEGQRFDFTVLSTDSSKQILALNFFYAGSPDCGWAKGLWPHQGSYTGFTSSSGIKSRKYQITNIGSSLRLGTFCHENGHMVCSWPDLYDYGYESSGVGGYCLMASSGSSNPRPPNPYLRDLKGWETLIEISADPPGTLRAHQVNSFITYRYSHPLNTREFFLLESRRKTGRDAGLPDEGLLIWHVDEDGSNDYEQMTPERHYRVSVEQADGKFELERGINSGGSNDLFHAGNNDRFDDDTLPDARWWSGVESGMAITNISAVSDNMTFVVDNVPVDLMIVPGAVREIRGLTGGPFAPSPVSYALTNLAATPVTWTASASADWLSVPPGGTLAGGAQTAVNATLTAVAATLPPGIYEDAIQFTDTTHEATRRRPIRLVVQPAELVAQWAFDETSGTTAADATGHGHSATLQGATFASNSTTGKFGRALDFDGLDDTVSVPGFTLPKPYFTISLWINPDTSLNSASSRFDLLYWDNGNHPHITFNRARKGEIGLYVEYETVEYEDIHTATQSWPAATWKLVTFTFDGTNYRVYVDGALERTYNHPGIHIDTADPYIGSHLGENNFFDGQIDDVRFYNYPLPAQAVAALYNGGRAENPEPVSSGVSVRPYTALRWLGGADVAGHHVYAGSDYAAVQNATAASPEYRGSTQAPFFTGLALDVNSEYFWRVDEAADRATLAGQVWRFTTGGPAGPYEDIYQAEDALLSGPQFATNREGYTGRGFADYINNSNDYIEWTVFAHYTGQHRLTFRYALAAGSRPLDIRVNGQLVAAAHPFPNTGSYDVWTHTPNLSVVLNTGYNTVRATAIGYQGPNVDYLKVIDVYDYAPPVTGLQLALQFDESSGTIASDSSGNGRHATLYNSPLWDSRRGRFGGALKFDGIDDYAEIPGYKGVQGKRPRTVAAWVRTADTTGADILSWGADAPGARWSLATDPATGAPGILVGNGRVFADMPVNDNLWRHIAAVLDADADPDVAEVRLYVDGLPRPAAAVAQPIDTASTAGVRLATFDDGAYRYFPGYIDDVVVFDLALTDREIARLCRLGAASLLVPCGRIPRDRDYDIRGDLNRDCVVDATDLLYLAENWLRDDPAAFADVDGSGGVDGLDFSMLAGHWADRVAYFDKPAPAQFDQPPHNATGVSATPTLSWLPGDGAVSHNVYFGPDYPPAFQTNQTHTTFTPGILAWETTYYWRIDEINAFGAATGTTWTFTVREKPPR